MADNNIGPKRLVVGAHYGLRDWLAQRATAVVMAVYTVILLVCFFTSTNFSYQAGRRCSRINGSRSPPLPCSWRCSSTPGSACVMR